MQKGNQPSQACSGGHITPNPTPKSIRVMHLDAYREYKQVRAISTSHGEALVQEAPW
jgi:ribulose-5-phosphate 4-epimerase/fuculose-1-phosphate aldolase